MAHKEIQLCLFYFILQGLLVPNFDDMHYVFLTDKCGITTYMYDFLNILSYAGQFFFCFIYSQWLSTFEVRRLIQYQLVILLFITLLQFEYALRIYENIPLLGEFNVKILGDNKLNDILVNSICFFCSSSALQVFSFLPMFVVLLPCIPDNVEAAMTSLISGVFVFSSDVGSRISAGMLCGFFGVDNESLQRYWIILLAKCPMILITIALTMIIPSNKEIAEAALRMDQED